MTEEEKKIIIRITLAVILIPAILGMLGLVILTAWVNSLPGPEGELHYSLDAIYIRSKNYVNYSVHEIKDDRDGDNAISIKTSIDGFPVISFDDEMEISGDGETSLYFPYTILNYDGIESITGISKVVSSDTSAVPSCDLGGATLVVPKLLYDSLQGTEQGEKCVPANIAYLYNYVDSPNENYYHVDLIEESGKIPLTCYRPERSGHVFLGWYTEPECINEWDFDNGVVEVERDMNGNAIFKEFRLYAKWS